MTAGYVFEVPAGANRPVNPRPIKEMGRFVHEAVAMDPNSGIVLCEDGGAEQFLRGLTQTGNIFDFVQTNGSLPEFCGATYDPVGDVLYFNIQGSTSATGTSIGYTFAMWGPWDNGVL